MEKKNKKRRVVLHERLQKLNRMLADAKKQCDSPDELRDLESQIKQIREELATIPDD